MTKVLIKAEQTTLVREADSLILQRPWKDEDQYLVDDYGALHEGDNLVKRFPTGRFLATAEEITNRMTIFREGCDFVCGMSGYSALNADRCAELNIREGDYEAAVMGLMVSAINRIHRLLPQTRLGLVYGSSAMGVDLAIEKVAKEKNIPLIGFTCLEYLWYVDNSFAGPYICVTKSKKDYCESYVHSCDLLMASNGGEVSYKMDIIAATKALIPVLPINVIGMLGASVPAFRPNGSVNDAVGALLHVLRLINLNCGHGLAEDKFSEVANDFANAVLGRAREVVPPQYAFPPLPE